MRDSNTERIGVYASALIFTKDIKWVFREQTIVDVGIDALIEESIDGNPTGQFIAAQIKTGLGNFHESINYLTYYVTNIHYNYWLNFNLPVILIAHLPNTEETIWELINERSLQSTDKQWKIKIPKSKHLNKDSLKELSNIIQDIGQDEFITELDSGIISDKLLLEITSELSHIDEARKSLTKITTIITDLGSGTSVYRERINHFATIGLNQNDKRVKISIKKYAEFINGVTRKLNIEIYTISLDFSIGFRAYEKLMKIDFELNKNYKSLQETFDTMIDLQLAIDDAIDGIKIMRNEASTLPNNFAHLKKAKNKFIDTVNQLLNEFKIAKEISLEFIKNIEKILK